MMLIGGGQLGPIDMGTQQTRKDDLDSSNFPALNKSAPTPTPSVIGSNAFSAVAKANPSLLAQLQPQLTSFNIQGDDFPALSASKQTASKSSDDLGSIGVPPGLSQFPLSNRRKLADDSDLSVYGLQPLLNVIHNIHPGLSTLALGIDLTTLGLNLTTTGHLYASFPSPFGDVSQKDKDQFPSLPACYNLKKVDPAVLMAKMPTMAEEVLFYIFYTMPHDAMQLHAASILFQRDWRFHKELKIWITRFHDPMQKGAVAERGTYYYFDVTAWKKLTRDLTVQYDQLEDRKVSL